MGMGQNGRTLKGTKTARSLYDARPRGVGR